MPPPPDERIENRRRCTRADVEFRRRKKITPAVRTSRVPLPSDTGRRRTHRAYGFGGIGRTSFFHVYSTVEITEEEKTSFFRAVFGGAIFFHRPVTRASTEYVNYAPSICRRANTQYIYINIACPSSPVPLTE